MVRAAVLRPGTLSVDETGTSYQPWVDCWGDGEVEDLPTLDSVTSLNELTYTPEWEPSATKSSRTTPPNEKHTALVRPPMTSAPGPHRSSSRGDTYHRKDHSPVINATTKSNSIIQHHRGVSARTEEDDGSEIGLH